MVSLGESLGPKLKEAIKKKEEQQVKEIVPGLPDADVVKLVVAIVGRDREKDPCDRDSCEYCNRHIRRECLEKAMHRLGGYNLGFEFLKESMPIFFQREPHQLSMKAASQQREILWKAMRRARMSKAIYALNKTEKVLVQILDRRNGRVLLVHPNNEQQVWAPEELYDFEIDSTRKYKRIVLAKIKAEEKEQRNLLRRIRKNRLYYKLRRRLQTKRLGSFLISKRELDLIQDEGWRVVSFDRKIYLVPYDVVLEVGLWKQASEKIDQADDEEEYSELLNMMEAVEYRIELEGICISTSEERNYERV